MRAPVRLAVLVVCITAFMAVPAHAHAAESRRAEFAKVCRGHTASQACDHFLAPVACSPNNPFLSGAFSCRYLLTVNPCHGDPGSSLCGLFLSNYCFDNPDGVACMFFRANSGYCTLMSTSGVAPPSPTCALFPPDLNCPVVEPDGSPPPSEACRVYAAAFLDYCQLRPQQCHNPYGGQEELPDFFTQTKPCPRRKGHRRRRRVCVAVNRQTPTPAATGGPITPWPFSTITYYIGQARSDGKPVPAPSQWVTPIRSAFRAWNAAHTGWVFKPAASAEQGDADVVVLAATRRADHNCVGVSVRGFGFTQVSFALGGACLRRGVLALAAAHEIGHLLGLVHEKRACSVMNPHFIAVGGAPRPSRCGPGAGYRHSLVQRFDVRSARALSRSTVASPLPCDPKGELPAFAQDPECKYRVTCGAASGRNTFNESGTAVIEAEIAARCRRVLRVAPVGEPPPPRAPRLVGGAGSFAGTSAQGKPVSFVVRHGVVSSLRVGAHFTCSDNTSQFANSIAPAPPSPDELALLGRLGLSVADERRNGDETLGPFPQITLSTNGLAATLEAPNGSAVYELHATFRGGAWIGTLQVTEGWHATGSPVLGLVPAPDGEIVCDTGQVSFTARRAP